MRYGANSDSRIAIAIQTLEDERMVLDVPLLVLSEEVIFTLLTGG
jgi:hypothetical protein